MSVVADLLAFNQDRMVVLVLALARVGGLCIMAPFFGARTAPVRVRAAVAFFLTLAMLPLAGGVPALVQNGGALTLLGMEAAQHLFARVYSLSGAIADVPEAKARGLAQRPDQGPVGSALIGEAARDGLG